METLRALHAAYAPEIRAFYRSLPVASGDRLLDIGCGEGIGCKWFAESVGPAGSVVGADRSAVRLAKGLADRERPAAVRFCRADAYQLPFRAGTFDVVCCSHSLITLRNTQTLLAEAIRVLRSGGRAIFLENDAMHHVVLPWPIELEIELHTAVYQAHLSRTDDPARHYSGRRLPKLLWDAGLTNVRALPCAIGRISPFDSDARKHLLCHFRDLHHLAAGHLSPCMSGRFEELIAPDGPLLNEPGVGLTVLDWAFVGEKTSA